MPIRKAIATQRPRLTARQHRARSSGARRTIYSAWICSTPALYWEAHMKSWEQLYWHACGRQGESADFLKALIKLAAAGVKHREGKPAGVHSHAQRAAILWRGLAAAQDVFFGLRLAELVERAEQIERAGWPAEAPLLLPT